MAGSVNKVILIGNLGKDPEIRRLGSGEPVVNLSLATSESWKDKSTGERKEKTEWHRVVIFNENIARVAEQYLKKGSKVYVEGQLQTRKWTDQSGQEKYSTEVVIQRFRGDLTLLDGRGGGGGEYEEQGQVSRGGDFGRSSPMERRPATAGAGAGGSRARRPRRRHPVLGFAIGIALQRIEQSARRLHRPGNRNGRGDPDDILVRREVAMRDLDARGIRALQVEFRMSRLDPRHRLHQLFRCLSYHLDTADGPILTELVGGEGLAGDAVEVPGKTFAPEHDIPEPVLARTAVRAAHRRPDVQPRPAGRRRAPTPSG